MRDSGKKYTNSGTEVHATHGEVGVTTPLQHIHLSFDPKLLQPLLGLEASGKQAVITTVASAIGLQLHKYSAFISDTVSLQLTFAGHSLLLQQSFATPIVFKALTAATEAVLKNTNYVGDVAIKWSSDNDEPGNDYTITITHVEEDGCEVNFTAPDKGFYKTTFANAGNHLRFLLEQVLNAPDALVGEFSCVNQEELAALAILNNGPVEDEVSRPELLHKLFEHTAFKYPDHIALENKQVKKTYRTLDQRANQLANQLIKQGVKPGDFVGILMKRRPEVFISMLAIMKAGAAYVPLDSGYPEDRVNFILQDCNARLVITGTPSQNKTFSASCPELNIDEVPFREESVNAPVININPDYAAYCIYTSGTTGRPKGVIITHASASNLVKAEGLAFGLTPNDMVLQGFSVAFDASVEEVWLAFRSGATLVQATEEVMYSGTDLAQFIQEENITAISTVPTMLSMMQPPLPSLRLLILGGEYCPYELLAPWHTPNLRIVNTYGPTEATVITTYADFEPGKKMTIGKPVANYSTFVLDEHQQMVPLGAPGELCIGGPGLAKGYLNRDELTAEKFVVPGFPNQLATKRIYRSGDLARFNDEGNIEFLGRIDSQVKLRGYRIELAEIESQLLQYKGIQNAVVAVKQDEHQVQKLVAYLILKPDTVFSEELCKAHLKSRLAVYMVPSVFVVLQEFPVLPSGKVDRKQLPMPEKEQLAEHRDIVLPRTDTETLLHNLWQKYFIGQEVSVLDDFFDLGGHSLLASLIVSELRKQPLMAQISVQDIYTYRTIERLATYINGFTQPAQPTAQKQPIKRVGWLTYFLVSTMQALSLFVLLILSSGALLLPYIVERLDPQVSVYRIITYALLGFFLLLPFMVVLSVTLKWVFIGRFKAGRYPLWGWYYFRFWLVKRLIDLTPTGFLVGTPFINLYYRLMGAKIGKGVYIGSERVRAFDMVTIGDNASISREAHIMGYRVEDGELIIGPIQVGKDCFVGTRAMISEGAVMEDGASLGELSLLREGETLPKGEHWEGSPAQKAVRTNLSQGDYPKDSNALPYPVYIALQIVALLFVLVSPFLLMIPFAFTFYAVDHYFGFGWAMLSTIPNMALYITFFCLMIAAFKWLILGKVAEEDFSIYSFRYIRKWTVDMLLHLSLMSFRSIYATLYLPPWLRLMGAKVGKVAEVSTVNQMSTDLLTIGSGSFLADSVSIGSPEVRNNTMQLRKILIGHKTFIGNSAVITSGDRVGSDSLVGVLSTPPTSIENGIINGTSWLGSPAMFLPKRQESAKFDVKYTFRPPRIMYFVRSFIEFFKITLPYAFSSALVAMFYFGVSHIMHGHALYHLLWVGPVCFLGIMLATPVITLFFKWILIGTYEPSNKPLWSPFVWKNELVNSLCENMVYPFLVNMLLGTPYAPIFFRLMGSKIGKRVYMETTEITEFDLVHIGDYASVNYLCTIQTHLFEDRVMKMSDLFIGDDCTVGAMSVVLYDSVMEKGSSIDGLSLVMKGEVIPQQTKWAGSPAKFMQG